ncbi:FCD domain-containing protein [Mesorhizobium sp. YR577]|uniref:FCD domain-containing protein n=1 Tax=Mesorhizobium sp. YR577 TaxID=1884373 RepID=UPI0008EEA3F2|nr:FCD domain-containing protein [Mesorhizobium sp. YR577]SFT59901.1 FCD domain-containing protein [Mesorhizobium sp. YR577]
MAEKQASLRIIDEEFHEQVAALSGNIEMLHTLRTINARIRFIRWVNMENGRRRQTQGERSAILEAIAERDAPRALSSSCSY